MNVLLNRLDSCQKKLLEIFYHGFNQQFSTCKLSFNDTVPGKSPCIPNFMDRYGPNKERVWFFLKNKPAYLENQWLLFFQQYINRLNYPLVRIYRNVICCIWFLATHTWLAENAKNCIFLWFVLIIKFDSFQYNRWFSHIQVIINDFATVERQLIIFLWEKFLTSETLRTEMARNCKKKNDFSWESSLFVFQSYWLNFVHQWINWHFSTHKNLPSKQQLPRFLPWRSQSTLSFFKRWLNTHIFFFVLYPKNW